MTASAGDPRRRLPAVHALLDGEAVRPLLECTPRALVADAVRAVLADARRDPAAAPRDDDGWRAAVAARVELDARPGLRPLFNATGVVLHTNLGRAPLAPAALQAIADVAAGFCNLEYDVGRGARGSRMTHCAGALAELTGAEDALVVNNCAAALVLALSAFARGRDAIVSRGELVEIGGSFRVPDIMAESGARLVEVGTTNRTHLADYERAIGDATGAVVRVHRSNFTMDGFVAEAPARELAALCAARGVPLVHDFGSGLLVSLERWGLRGEPTAADAVRDGATVVVMSGDKLLGGPQAGILCGSRDAIARLRSHPLARALRVDKLTLAALGATLALYRAGAEHAARAVPALRMLTAPADEVRERAASLAARLGAAGCNSEVVATEASVGGGAFPAARIASWALSPEGDAAALERALRAGATPVVARVADGRLLLDVRSVPEAHDAAFGDAVIAALAGAA